LKKIIISINTTWNIYNFRLGLVKTLLKQGYEVYAVSPKDGYVEKLEKIGLKHIDIKINNKGTNPIEDMKLIYDYYKIFKEIQPDVALLYTIKPNIYGNIAAKFSSIKTISNISGLGTVFLHDNFSSKVARFLYKIALKQPQKVFFQNNDDKNLFVKNNLIDPQKTDILPGSGINTKIFKPVCINKNNDKFIFLMIARLVRDKGIMEYIKAAEIIKNKYKDKVEFWILGSFYFNNPTAITSEEIKKWEEKNIIKYLGTSDNVKDFILKADCIVLPSYREGLSRVLLESASMAKPIITTNVPGCRDVVDDGINGYLCKLKDYKDLADKMEKMLNLTEEKRKKMGKAGRKKILKEFDEKIVIEKYLETIEKLLKKL